MKKTFKIIGGILILSIFLLIGFGFYMYTSNPMIKALVDNDESKLFYFPVKKVEGLADFKYEEIPLQVEDTVTIYAYLFKPKTDSVKASVFFIHGSGGNVGIHSKSIKPLVDGGFQVYAFDWRGFGKSNGKPMHANVLTDTKVAFDDMKSREGVKSTKIVVLGQSLGGQVAVRLTKEYEPSIDALVLDGSVASFPTLAEDFAPIEFLKNRAQNNPDDFNQPYSAIEDIKDIKETPKLIIQSSEDRTVLPIRGQMIFENAKEPKKYWQTEGKHIYTLINYPEEAVLKIERLLK
jgi:uncharacterized protein